VEIPKEDPRNLGGDADDVGDGVGGEQADAVEEGMPTGTGGWCTVMRARVSGR